jgi:hypothetical protein
VAWLNTHVKFWEARRERWSDEKWHTEVVELYDFFLDPGNALGLRSCSVCQLGFDSPAWMRLHFESYSHQCKRAEIMGEPKPADPMYCKLCDFRAFSHRKMECHKKTYEHAKARALSEGKPVPTNDKYCKICDQHFCSAQVCSRHFRSEKHLNAVAKKNNTTIFKCIPCECEFSSKQSYKNHLKSNKHCIQNRTKKALATNCTICDRSYKNRRQYLKHCYTKSHKLKVAEGAVCMGLKVLVI